MRDALHRSPTAPRRRVLLVSAAIAASAVVVGGGGFLAATAANAATGCRVNYTVNQWPSGFTGNVELTNLGDPVTSWSLVWTFSSGQRVTQGWNSTIVQSGSQVTATNASWNGGLATNSSVSFGFNASWAGSNAAPTSFTLNGTTCTGSVGGTPPAPTTAPPPPSPSPTATAGPPSPPPVPSPTPTQGPPSPPPPTSGWNPPANLVSPLAAVWKHQEETYNNGNLYGFKNFGWDQLMANKGYVNYCVRWDSSANVTTAQRDAIHTALRRQVKKWLDPMAGHNAFPYTDVKVNIVGWAVRNRAQLQWSDTSVDIYVNNIRENAPQCSEPCGRFFNQNGDYSRCPGGVARHYDQSLWLTAGFAGGAGGDWGQRIGAEYMMNSVNNDNIHILLHELGHTYGLDDFYDWDPLNGQGFIMKAGSASTITEFDKWMFRDWWRHLKSRYGY